MTDDAVTLRTPSAARGGNADMLVCGVEPSVSQEELGIMHQKCARFIRVARRSGRKESVPLSGTNSDAVNGEQAQTRTLRNVCTHKTCQCSLLCYKYRV